MLYLCKHFTLELIYKNLKNSIQVKSVVYHNYKYILCYL